MNTHTPREPLVQLLFLNRSSDPRRPRVVVWQDFRDSGLDAAPIAWKVIRSCGYDMRHPFIFPLHPRMTVETVYGNHTLGGRIQPNQQWVVREKMGRKIFQPEGGIAQDGQVTVANDLSSESVRIVLWRDIRVVAKSRPLSPGQFVSFRYTPDIRVGVAPEVEEGQYMTEELAARTPTQLSLAGLSSTTLLMTGGGNGSRATAFHFCFVEVVETTA